MICYNPMEEERLVVISIAGMLFEYHPYLDNLQIPSFTRLVKVARRISILVKKPSKSSTSQTIIAPKQYSK